MLLLGQSRSRLKRQPQVYDLSNEHRYLPASCKRSKRHHHLLRRHPFLNEIHRPLQAFQSLPHNPRLRRRHKRSRLQGPRKKILIDRLPDLIILDHAAKDVFDGDALGWIREPLLRRRDELVPG